MPLNLPPDTVCFVDSNIFVYHLVEVGAPSLACRAFLQRVLASEIVAATTTACLADVIHRVMIVEAQQRFATAKRPAAWLQRHPDRIKELSAFVEAAAQLELLPLRLLEPGRSATREAAGLSRRYGLLTNDALIVALMRQHEITHLVTNDDDFDNVAELSIWKPR